MKTKDEIDAVYLAQHNALGSRKDAEDKDLFDQQHAQIWADCDAVLQDRKIELQAKVELTPEEEQELAKLEALFPTPRPPTEDELRVKELLATSPLVITQPEIWELLRILGRKLGF
jgi:hypothetical protein